MCICRVQQREHVQVFVYTLHNLRFLFYFDLLLTTCDVSRVSADTPPLLVPTLRSWRIKKPCGKFVFFLKEESVSVCVCVQLKANDSNMLMQNRMGGSDHRCKTPSHLALWCRLVGRSLSGVAHSSRSVPGLQDKA